MKVQLESIRQAAKDLETDIMNTVNVPMSVKNKSIELTHSIEELRSSVMDGANINDPLPGLREAESIVDALSARSDKATALQAKAKIHARIVEVSPQPQYEVQGVDIASGDGGTAFVIVRNGKVMSKSEVLIALAGNKRHD